MTVQYMRTTENSDENEKHYTITNTSIAHVRAFVTTELPCLTFTRPRSDGWPLHGRFSYRVVRAFYRS